MSEAAAINPEHQPSTSTDTINYRPLRIWPPVLLLIAMILARWIPALWENGPENVWMFAVFGPAVCGISILLWWLLVSRATWPERLIGFAGAIAAFAITFFVVDESFRGPAMLILTIPVGTALFGIGAVMLSRKLNFGRTMFAIFLALIGFGFSGLLRTDGVWGDFALGLDWRWNETKENLLVASKAENAESISISDVTNELDTALANPEWPGFRGADRTSHVRGVSLSPDWEANPPEQLWKIAVGPGWSSFAVAGDLLFTQEQRGPMECVVCYAGETGKEIWSCEIESRFEEAIAGPGPRATPTIANGQLYAFGAQGFLLRINPADGSIVWQKDVREIAERDPPMWGFSSSPLVTEGNVVVHAGGAGDKGVLAFNTETGELTWSTAAGGHSYCSPQLNEIGGETFMLVGTDRGLNVIDPLTGEEKLDYEWKHGGYRTVQPQVLGGDSIVLPTGVGMGTRLIKISNSGESMEAEEVWTSLNLKPDYNDFVIHKGYAYGFDVAIFTCINLETGEREWKRGRYGKGQVVLIEDSEQLLVAGEKGDVILLTANPQKHTELAKFQAIEGKTWNHPVVVGDRLYIRNGEEAACYRLPVN